MASVFLEIWFEGDSLEQAGIYGRSAIEDPVDEALEESGLGEVYGGGGERGSDIAIEIFNARNLEKVIALLRKVLREEGAPANTQIIRHKPKRVVYGLADE
jgi:hypothetical protein